MIFERLNKRYEITGSERPVFRRNGFLYVSLVLAFCLLAFSRVASSAPVCSTPGNDGVGAPSGVINTYYPGTSSVSAGATSIPVGFPSGNLSKLITTGDLLIVIQMQDADINYTNTASYGGSGSGSG